MTDKQFKDYTLKTGIDLTDKIPLQENGGTVKYFLGSNLLTGWYVANETWTYASADAPTFTFTIPGDQTTRYSGGMKIQLTQEMIKYFIITQISYSSGTGLTTITIFGGTDYALTNATITSPYFSFSKAPVGFPLNPEKWVVSYTNITTYTQSSPTGGAYYNFGSSSITIPTGVWCGYIEVTLEDNINVLSGIYAYLSLSSSSLSGAITLYREDFYNASIRTNHFLRYNFLNFAKSSKSTYYFLRSSSASVTQIGQSYLTMKFYSQYL